jgi:hypothetical protein
MYDERGLDAQIERIARRGGGAGQIGQTTSAMSDAFAAATGLFILLLGFITFEALKEGIGWAWPRITSGVVGYKLQIATGLLILVVGSLFFWLRQVRPTYYGVGEIGFALALGVYSAFPNAAHPDRFQIAFGGIGAVYLVVRGLDNATRRLRETRERTSRAQESKRIREEILRDIGKPAAP